MGTPSPWSPAARRESFRHAWNGLRTAFRTQPNARIHAGVTVCVVGLAWALDVTRGAWVALLLAVALVWLAELLNTALEALCDALHPDPHPLVGRCKDVAAGAVLLTAAAAAGVGLLVLGPPLWRWLG